MHSHRNLHSNLFQLFFQPTQLLYPHFQFVRTGFRCGLLEAPPGGLQVLSLLPDSFLRQLGLLLDKPAGRLLEAGDQAHRLDDHLPLDCGLPLSR